MSLRRRGVRHASILDGTAPTHESMELKHVEEMENADPVSSKNEVVQNLLHLRASLEEDSTRGSIAADRLRLLQKILECSRGSTMRLVSMTRSITRQFPLTLDKA